MFLRHILSLNKVKYTDLNESDGDNNKGDKKVAKEMMSTIDLSIDDICSIRSNRVKIYPVEPLQEKQGE